MLDKVNSSPKKKTAFDVWWSGLPRGLREKSDLAFARRCFRAGHLVGGRPVKSKYTFRAGKLLVSVWAENQREALREAVIELDYRVAQAGKRPPASGWRLTPVADT
ncbi:hypothetical protein E0H55_27445 [Rhizobium leguminosarum bv. viciae]|nr:hypothetical protein E0H55_27445 [Rhizobium leguminosarum bv. viciae]